MCFIFYAAGKLSLEREPAHSFRSKWEGRRNGWGAGWLELHIIPPSHEAGSGKGCRPAGGQGVRSRWTLGLRTVGTRSATRERTDRVEKHPPLWRTDLLSKQNQLSMCLRSPEMGGPLVMPTSTGEGEDAGISEWTQLSEESMKSQGAPVPMLALGTRAELHAWTVPRGGSCSLPNLVVGDYNNDITVHFL